jgi:hypothetical protein
MPPTKQPGKGRKKEKDRKREEGRNGGKEG